MNIKKSKIKKIIIEEFNKLNEQQLEEIGWKDIAPWALAGAAALSPLKSNAQQNTQDAAAQSSAAQDSSQGDSEQVEDVLFDSISVSSNAVDDLGGEEKLTELNTVVKKSIEHVLQYFSRRDVQIKLIKLSGVKKLPEDFIAKLTTEMSVSEVRNEEGNYKISIWSPRDINIMIGKKGVYFPSMDIVAFNAAVIGRGDIQSFKGVIDHELHHKALHKIQKILNIEKEDFFKSYDPDHKDEENLTSDRDRNISAYLKKPMEASAYSYIFRNSLGVSNITSTREVINKIQEAIKKANNGTKLVSLGNGLYSITGTQSWHRDIQTKDFSMQFMSALGNSLGEDVAEQIGRTIMPFSKKIVISGKTYIAFDVAALVKSLNALAAKETATKTRTA